MKNPLLKDLWEFVDGFKKKGSGLTLYDLGQVLDETTKEFKAGRSEDFEVWEGGPMHFRAEQERVWEEIISWRELFRPGQLGKRILSHDPADTKISPLGYLEEVFEDDQDDDDTVAFDDDPDDDDDANPKWYFNL